MQEGTCSLSPAVKWQKWLGSFWFVGGCSLKHTTGFCRPQTKRSTAHAGGWTSQNQSFQNTWFPLGFSLIKYFLWNPNSSLGSQKAKNYTCVLGKFVTITPSHNSNNGHYHREWMRWTGPRTSQEGWVVMMRSTCRDWGRVGDSRSLSFADWSLKREWEEARTRGITKQREKQHQAAVTLDSERRLQCWLQQLSSAHMREQESLWSRELQEGPSEVTEGEGSVGESGWLQIQTGLRSTQQGQMDQGRRSVSQLKSTGRMRKGSDRCEEGRGGQPGGWRESEQASTSSVSHTHTPPSFLSQTFFLSRTTHICPLPGLVSLIQLRALLHWPWGTQWLTFFLHFCKGLPPRSNLLSLSAPQKQKLPMIYLYAFSALHTGEGTLDKCLWKEIPWARHTHNPLCAINVMPCTSAN